MKHDPVIDELRPYLQEVSNDKFGIKAHQKDIREQIDAVQEDDHGNINFRQPQEGDLDFEDDLEDTDEPPTAPMQGTHSSSTMSSSSQNKMSSALSAITEYCSDDDDDSDH